MCTWFDLFIEETCIQVIWFSIRFFVSFMDYDDDVVGLWCYVIWYLWIDRCCWQVSPECVGHLTDWGYLWYQWTSLDFRSSQGVDCIWFGYFYLWICDIWSGILWWCLWIIASVSLMDAGWNFISNQNHIRSKVIRIIFDTKWERRYNKEMHRDIAYIQ